MIIGIISLVLMLIGICLTLHGEDTTVYHNASEYMGNTLFIVGLIGTMLFLYANFSIIIGWFKI